MLQPDQILQDRYQLKALLGDNASRQTWLAEDLETEDPVVLKLLVLGAGVQWQDFRLFEREIQILQALDHPRIPRYRGHFSLDDSLFWLGLVQEYVPGQSLAELLHQGERFTESEIRQITIQILDILIYLHELNPPVLHRDIKPGNLILGEDGQIYLVDFGAVQDRLAAGARTVTVVGTYGYTPIEQFGGQAVPASDLYALGATLIHLMTGLPPAELPQEEMRIAFWNYTSASPSFVDWVITLTEPAVERRFKTAREALDMLEKGEPLTQRRGAFFSLAAPEGTPISLQKSCDRLWIEIPARLQGLSLLDVVVSMAILGAIALVADTLIFRSLFLLVLFVLLGPIVLGFLGAATVAQSITLTPDTFRILRTLFGFSVYERVGDTAEIESVSCHMHALSHQRVSPILLLPSSFRLVALQTVRGKYMFGGYLSEDEVNWLVQEIQNWLRTYG
ncbi:hypothetical protein BST81_12670 [Leptolyngbya sp. 'hensonii']|uniref:serine/threonine protein kinase n=1 Tax=Leptolyngbya sp. 'hensonii' TaxID=1922337 RepID=UPI00094FAE9A|nr:serine/threonine-protein kinase [Leptolyngbya sp. 'hensonii']OLP17906.1 hypothetical protein BST81_12670 [Leptolyngbya sp. 'hensonii']